MTTDAFKKFIAPPHALSGWHIALEPTCMVFDEKIYAIRWDWCFRHGMNVLAKSIYDCEKALSIRDALKEATAFVERSTVNAVMVSSPDRFVDQAKEHGLIVVWRTYPTNNFQWIECDVDSVDALVESPEFKTFEDAKSAARSIFAGCVVVNLGA